MRSLVLGCLLLMTLPRPVAAAAATHVVPYAGRLVDASGAPRVGPVHLRARFHRAPTGAAAIGPTVELPAVKLEGGAFTVDLSLDAAALATLFDGGEDVWIEIEDVAANKRYPRQKLGAVPLALRVPIDDATLRYDADGRLTVQAVAGGGTVTSVTAGVGLTGGAITSSGTIALQDPLPPVDGGDLVNVSAARIQGRAVSSATPSSGHVLKWDGNAWVPSPDDGGVSGAISTGQSLGASDATTADVYESTAAPAMRFRRLKRGAGISLTQNANDVTIASTVTLSDLGGAPTSRQITAGAGLTGGGSLAADRTLSLDIAGLTAKTTSAAADLVAVHDVGAGALRRMTRGDFLAGAVSGGPQGAIVDGSITAVDLADGAVSGGPQGVIVDGSIATEDLADGAVTSAKLGGVVALAKGGTGADGSSLAAGLVLASPAGAPGAATYRALQPTDVPSLAASKITDLDAAIDARAANAKTLCPDGTYLRGEDATTCRTAAQIVGDGVTATTGKVPRWSGTALVDGALFDDGAGRVGLGTTSPADKLDVRDGSRRLVTLLQQDASNGASLEFYRTSDNQPMGTIGFYDGFAGITATGGFRVAGTTYFDGSVSVGSYGPLVLSGELQTFANQHLVMKPQAGYHTVVATGGLGVGVVPTTELDVDGTTRTTNLQVTGSSPSAGKVLVSDASGNASWTSLSAILGGLTRDLFVRTDPTLATTRVNVTAAAAVLPGAGTSYVIAESVDVHVATGVSGAGGLDTGAVAANTWYYVWLISNGTTTSALLSTSATAPTMPSGYGYKLLVSVARTNASSQILPFIQVDKDYGYIGYYTIVANGAATGYTSVPLAAVVPPLVRKVEVSILAQPFGAGTYGGYCWLSNDGVNAAGYAYYRYSNTTGDYVIDTSRFEVNLHTPQTLWYVSDLSTASCYMYLHGFRLP